MDVAHRYDAFGKFHVERFRRTGQRVAQCIGTGLGEENDAASRRIRMGFAAAAQLFRQQFVHQGYDLRVRIRLGRLDRQLRCEDHLAAGFEEGQYFG